MRGREAEGGWAFTHERKRSPAERKELAASKRMGRMREVGTRREKGGLS